MANKIKIKLVKYVQYKLGKIKTKEDDSKLTGMGAYNTIKSALHSRWPLA